jgi:hypothetical protein
MGDAMGSNLMCTGESYEKSQITSVDDQLLFLKSKGVTFSCLDGTCARHVLSHERTLTQLYAYRTLFERRTGGTRDGTYIGLDFSHMVRLSCLDQRFRQVMLALSLDIEHAARTRIVVEASKRKEDGFEVVEDYFASLPPHELHHRRVELSMLRKDTYNGPLYKCYGEHIPLEAYVELVSFGTLSDLYLHCAKRWDNEEFLREHYLFKSVRRMRNACAHGAPILKGIASQDARTGLDDHVVQAIAQTGIAKRVRSKQTKSECTRHMVTVLYAHKALVTDQFSRSQARATLRALLAELKTCTGTISSSDALRSFATYLDRIVRSWYDL